MANSDFLERLQQKLKDTNGTWEAGETSLSRLSEAQRKARFGFIPPEGELSREDMIAKSSATHEEYLAAKSAGVVPDYPPEVDWRDIDGQSYVTSVKDQGDCGSCSTFAVAAAVESVARIEQSLPMDSVLGVSLPELSEAQLLYCYGAKVGASCQKGIFRAQVLDFVKNYGVAPAGYFPYTAGNQSCNVRAGWEEVMMQISGYKKLGTDAEIKTALAKDGPLAAGMYMQEDILYYKSGVYKPTLGKEFPNHSVCVVGYSDVRGAWLVKNSHGTEWGEGGFAWIEYGPNGLFSQMETVTSVTKSPNMGLLGVGLNHNMWTRSALEGTWYEVADSGQPAALTVLDNGTILCAGLNSYLHTRKTLTSDWVLHKEAQKVRGLAVMKSGMILGVSWPGKVFPGGVELGRLMYRKNLDTEWTLVLNGGWITDVTATSDGTIYGIGDAGEMHSRTSINEPWELVAGSGTVKSITTMPDDTIVGVGMNNQMHTWDGSAWNWVENSGDVFYVAAVGFLDSNRAN